MRTTFARPIHSDGCFVDGWDGSRENMLSMDLWVDGDFFVARLMGSIAEVDVHFDGRLAAGRKNALRSCGHRPLIQMCLLLRFAEVGAFLI